MHCSVCKSSTTNNSAKCPGTQKDYTTWLTFSNFCPDFRGAIDCGRNSIVCLFHISVYRAQYLVNKITRSNPQFLILNIAKFFYGEQVILAVSSSNWPPGPLESNIFTWHKPTLQFSPSFHLIHYNICVFINSATEHIYFHPCSR